MSPAEILETASAAVTGPRNGTHGDYHENFATIARFWTLYLTTKGSTILDPADVARMMVLMKMCRRLNGGPCEDHDIDSAGYAAIAGALDVAG